MQPVAQIVTDHFDLGRSYRFGEMYAIFEPIESSALGIVADCGLRARRFVQGNAATMPCQQEIAFRFGFFQFLLQLLKSALQQLDLCFLILDLFFIALRDAQ